MVEGVQDMHAEYLCHGNLKFKNVFVAGNPGSKQLVAKVSAPCHLDFLQATDSASFKRPGETPCRVLQILSTPYVHSS